MVFGGVPMRFYRTKHAKKQEVRWRPHLLLTHAVPLQVSHFERKKKLYCRAVTDSPSLRRLAGIKGHLDLLTTAPFYAV
jgi:hypothetical protein